MTELVMVMSETSGHEESEMSGLRPTTRDTSNSAEELTVRLRDAITRLNRRLRQERPVGDLTVTQLSALTSLNLGGALTLRELSDVERVQPPTMTKIVAKLEERELVQRSPHPTDGRQVLLSATAQGASVLDAYQELRDVWLASKLAQLTPGDRDVVARAASILEALARHK